METKLKARDFVNFLKALSPLNHLCSDVEIRGGILRQRSRDKASIFEMDFSRLIPGCDVVMCNLKSKLTLLKELSKDEVKISITDNDISFSGQRSTFRFVIPRFLDDKFLSDEEFANLFTLKEEDVVLEHAFEKDISKLMKATTNQFNIVSLQMVFKGNTAELTATTSSKDQFSTIETGILVKKPLKGYSNLVTTPFLIDRDDELLLRMHNIYDTIFINKFLTNLGKVKVNVYCRSQLMEEEESSTLPREEGMKPGNGMHAEEAVLTDEGQEEKSDDAE